MRGKRIVDSKRHPRMNFGIEKLGRQVGFPAGGLRSRIILITLTFLLLPWDAVMAQSFSGLEFGKLVAYAKKSNQKDLLGVLEGLADGRERPLYVVFPPEQTGHTPVPSGGSKEEAGDQSSSTKRAWTSLAALIFKNESRFSSIPDATALFIRDISHEEVVVAALSQILREKPPELFDNNVEVLSPDDLDDLRKIVRINESESSANEIPQFRAVQEFVSSNWVQKQFILTSLHPAQLTLISGFNRGERRMTVIHCFLTVGTLPTIDVAPDMQELVRGLVGLLHGDVPVSVRLGVNRIAEPLSDTELQAISESLGVVLSGSDSMGSQEPFHRILPVDHENKRVIVLLLVPRGYLRRCFLVISLRSNRFVLLKPGSRERVSEIRIAESGWLGTAGEGVKEIELQVVENSRAKGEHEEFRSYSIPLAVAVSLTGPDCRELMDAPVGDGSQALARDTVGRRRTRVGCEEALEYLGAIQSEIRIAKELAGEGAKVQIILHEPQSSWVSPARRRARKAAVAIGDYLRNRAAELNLEGSAIHQMIRVSLPGPEEGRIEIRLAE